MPHEAIYDLNHIDWMLVEANIHDAARAAEASGDTATAEQLDWANQTMFAM